MVDRFIIKNIDVSIILCCVVVLLFNFEIDILFIYVRYGVVMGRM